MQRGMLNTAHSSLLPSTVNLRQIINYEERFTIEVPIKELKSYVNRESNDSAIKKSNYGFIFCDCLANHKITQISTRK